MDTLIDPQERERETAAEIGRKACAALDDTFSGGDNETLAPESDSERERYATAWIAALNLNVDDFASSWPPSKNEIFAASALKHRPDLQSARSAARLEAAQKVRMEMAARIVLTNIADASDNLNVKGQDARLLRNLARFDVLSKARFRSFSTIEDDDERDFFLYLLDEKTTEIHNSVEKCPPRTLEGFRALAASIILAAADCVDESGDICCNELNEELVMILVDSLAPEILAAALES